MLPTIKACYLPPSSCILLALISIKRSSACTFSPRIYPTVGYVIAKEQHKSSYMHVTRFSPELYCLCMYVCVFGGRDSSWGRRREKRIRRKHFKNKLDPLSVVVILPKYNFIRITLWLLFGLYLRYPFYT